MGEYDDDLALFSEFVADAQAVPYYDKWQQANKNGDAPKWRAFRDALLAADSAAIPDMSTRYGQMLVDAGRQHMSISHLVGVVTAPFPPPDPPPVPPPPSGDLLTWKSPSALNVLGVGVPLVEFTLTDATRNSATLNNTANGIGSKDIRITQTQAITSGSMATINGWRHIEWIGGEMNLNAASSASGALIIRNCVGICHLEGIWLHGNSMHDCLVYRSDSPPSGHVSQVQNCRFEAQDDPTEHADCVQFQGSRLDAFRYDKCTFVSELQGTFMRVGTSGPTTGDYARNGSFKRVNYRGTGDNTFWQGWEQNDSTVEFKKIIPITLDNVWVAEDGDTRSVGMRVLPRSDFTSSPQAGGPRRGNFPGTDGTGQFTRFSTTADIVPTGSAVGQQCLDCSITGIIRKGIPPGGDYVIGSNIGIGYTSPGYV